MHRGVHGRPALDAWLAGARRGPPFPLHFTGFRVEGYEETTDVHRIATHANQDMIPDNQRSRRGEVLQSSVGDSLTPALLSGVGVNTDHPVVGPEEIQPALVHSEATIADEMPALI